MKLLRKKYLPISSWLIRDRTVQAIAPTKQSLIAPNSNQSLALSRGYHG